MKFLGWEIVDDVKKIRWQETRAKVKCMRFQELKGEFEDLIIRFVV